MSQPNVLLRIKIISLIVLIMIAGYAYVVVFGSVDYKDPIAVQVLAIIAGTLIAVMYKFVQYRRTHPV